MDLSKKFAKKNARPKAPEWVVPNLEIFLDAIATVMRTEGLSLLSIMKFCGDGVIICDCASVEIFISVS